MATRKFPRFDMPQIQSEDHAPDSIKCILDENLSVTQTALAFQRWRNLHLKNLFSHELKKVLEEAQKDEACLTFMEQEISSKEQQLARALADSAQLRAQLSGLNFANENNQDSNEVEHRQRKGLLEALERAKIYEENAEKYAKEIETLREKLQITEDEKCKIIAKLEADLQLLQKERDCSFSETRGLRDQELDTTLQGRRVKQEKGHEVVSTELARHLKQLAAYVRNLELSVQNDGNVSGYEKKMRSKQNRVQNGSVKSQEPATAHSNSSGHVHLANYLEHSCGGTVPFSIRKSSQLHCEFKIDTAGDGKNEHFTRHSPQLFQTQKMLSSQYYSQEKITQASTSDAPKTFTNMLSKCISWKWRWVAAASQLKALSNGLQNVTITKSDMTTEQFRNALHTPIPGHNKFVSSMQKLGFIHVQSLQNSHVQDNPHHTPKVRQREAKISMPGRKVISIMLSMWRASIKTAKLEKEAVNKSEKLSKLLSGLPWLLHRFEERRHLERIFLHWVFHVLRSKIQTYHSSIHFSSWPYWQKRPPSSLWSAQLGLDDPRINETSGYQGKYMKYVHNKPSERQIVSEEVMKDDMRKTHNRSPSISDFTICNHRYLNQNSSIGAVEVDAESPPFEVSSPVQKDGRLSFRHSRCTAGSAESTCQPNKIGAGHHHNTVSPTDDLVWNRRCNVTTFTEKAMQALQVSLYNELQMLQELIVKEARSHQEKTGNKEKHIDDVDSEHLGDNASHFSSSLWRICNGLANCLIDARNQILVLAADSKSTTLPKTGALLKTCSKSMGILGHPNLGNKTCNKASPEKAKVRFQDDCEEQKLKEETNGHRKMQTDFIESTDNAQSSTLMGTGGKRRDRHENAVNTPGRRRTERYSLIFSKRNKRGPHYASLIQSRMAQSKWWHNLRDQ